MNGKSQEEKKKIAIGKTFFSFLSKKLDLVKKTLDTKRTCLVTSSTFTIRKQRQDKSLPPKRHPCLKIPKSDKMPRNLRSTLCPQRAQAADQAHLCLSSQVPRQPQRMKWTTFHLKQLEGKTMTPTGFLSSTLELLGIQCRLQPSLHQIPPSRWLSSTPEMLRLAQASEKSRLTRDKRALADSYR